MSAAAHALRTFEGVPHRLQVGSVVDGVSYVNDSKATNVDATLKALTAYSGGVHLILGGYDKGAEYGELAAATEGQVKQALLIGATAPQLEAAFAARAAVAGAHPTPYVRCGDLEGAVRRGRRLRRTGRRGPAQPGLRQLGPVQGLRAAGRTLPETGERPENKELTPVRTSGRPAEHVDLDHGDWVEDPPRRARSGGDRRATERRGSAGQAPARERRSGERRTNERRSSATAAAPSARSLRERPPARRTQPRNARPPATVLGPGVAERRTLMLVTFLLVVYGLVMAYSASAAQAYFEHGSSFYLFGRQVAWVGIGVGAMYVLSRVDYAWFRKAAVPLAGLAFAGLVLVLVPGIGSVHQRRPPLDLPRRPGLAAQ